MKNVYCVEILFCNDDDDDEAGKTIFGDPQLQDDDEETKGSRPVVRKVFDDEAKEQCDTETKGILSQ